MKDKKSIILFIVVIAAFGGVPFVLNPERSYIVYLLFLAFTYIALTQGVEPSWGIHRANLSWSECFLWSWSLCDRYILASRSNRLF